MPPSRRRATLATVAASAGVSVATVSKVLNGRSDVAPECKSRFGGKPKDRAVTSNQPGQGRQSSE
ncbi:LacI family DNA-binding transcriptional regulator, partial [Microbispora rosea]